MAETTVEFDAGLFRSNVEKVFERAKAGLQIGLETEAFKLLGEANAAVPIESGTLESSSFVDTGPTAAGNPAATVGYEAPYAGAVHEGFHHGKQTKTPHQFWLQTAANQFSSGFAERMAEVVRQEVGD